MEFSYHKFDAREFTLYPLGDFHVGSPQCNESFIKKVIEEIRDNPQARWVGMGDLMENAIIGSKSDVYKQILPPKEQLEYIVELLSPIKDKGLFLIAGNHEQRTMRVVGLMPEQYVSIQLGIPYMGYSCLAVFQLVEAERPNTFMCYFHHNYGGGYSKGGKVNRSIQLRSIVPTADATFSGHFHVTARTPVTWYDAKQTKVAQRIGYDYIIGSALDYNNSYAEERAKPAAVTEFIKVTFVGSTHTSGLNREQIYEVITSNGGK
jgi:hypothetical protein